jgi:hypothetical protein
VPLVHSKTAKRIILSQDPSEPVQAWPSGFKMVAGSPTAKTPNKMYTYYCHRKPDLSDEISSDHFNFDDPCLGGIKFDLSFFRVICVFEKD